MIAEIAQAKQHWFLPTNIITSLANSVLNEARQSVKPCDFYNPEDLLESAIPKKILIN